MGLGVSLGVSVGGGVSNNPIRKAIAILAKFGTNAHVYLPGVGQLNGLTAGNYLLADGSTGLTPVDGLVGLELDAAGAVGSELVTNGDFSNGATGWALTQPTSGSITISGGLATINTVDGSYASIIQAPTIEAGATYYYELTVTSCTGPGIAIVIGGTQRVTAINSVGVFSGYLTASSTAGLEIKRLGAGSITNTSFDNISVKQVTGIHATASGAARPTLRRGAVNLLTYSGNYGGATGWTAINANTTCVTGVADSHDGFSTCTEVTGVSAGAVGYYGAATVNRGLVAGVSYIGSCWVKSISGSTLLNFNGGANASANQTITTSWTRVSGVVISANAVPAIYLVGAGVFRICGCQFEVGTTNAPSAYSPTTTTAASNANEGKYSLEFAGAQSLALGSVPFQMADDHCVIAAGKVDNGTVPTQTLFGCSNNTLANPIVGQLSFNTTGVTANLRDDAGNLIAVGAGALSVGEVFVGSMKRTSGFVVARKNGVAGSLAATSSLGATTINSASVGASVRNTTVNDVTGSIGPVIAIKGTVTDSDLLTLERFVSSLTPNGPAF